MQVSKPVKVPIPVGVKLSAEQCWVPIILVITPLLLYFHPLLIFLCPYCPHIVITVPHRIPLLLFLWLYIIIVRSAKLYCNSLDSYI